MCCRSGGEGHGGIIVCGFARKSVVVGRGREGRGPGCGKLSRRPGSGGCVELAGNTVSGYLLRMMLLLKIA